MYIRHNPNPCQTLVGDCVIRAVSTVTGQDWDTTYVDICKQGFQMCDMPSSNHVWGEYLKSKGFVKEVVHDGCPQCYTVREFCADHPSGTFVLATGTHVIAVINGDYWDSWDSGGEIPVYLWRKEN